MGSLKHLMAISIFCLFIGAADVAAQPTAFTYQGRLSDNIAAANGAYHMQFSLHTTSTPMPDDQVGPTLTFDGTGGNLPAVQVTNGIFTVRLDFHSLGTCATCFDGSARWLQVALKRSGDPTYTVLPRQPIDSTPYAQKSASAGVSDALGSNCLLCVTDAQIQAVGAGKLTGVVPITSGGTGSSAKNFVDLTTTQSIGGNKTFTGAQVAVGGNFFANLGQSGRSVHGSSAITLTTGSAFTAIPGLSVTVGPHNGYAFVYFSTSGGIQVNSSSATGFTIVDIAIFVDGIIVANGGMRRYIVSNSSVLVTQIGNWSFSDILFLETPSHTIEVRARVISPSNSGAVVSGGSDNSSQGTLSVAVLRSWSGPG